jgi:hypothetical protein
VHGSWQFAENQAPHPVLFFEDEAPVAMNALESVVESRVDPRGGIASRSAFVSGGPAQSEVRWRLHTAISSRFGRLIAAVSSLESTDITDKWAARLDCVPVRHGFPPRTQAHRVRV